MINEDTKTTIIPAEAGRYEEAFLWLKPHNVNGYAIYSEESRRSYPIVAWKDIGYNRIVPVAIGGSPLEEYTMTAVLDTKSGKVFAVDGRIYNTIDEWSEVGRKETNEYGGKWPEEKVYLEEDEAHRARAANMRDAGWPVIDGGRDNHAALRERMKLWGGERREVGFPDDIPF